jgi:MarR family transcriptional regulator, organic hydroperoxide resistance regulator
MQVIHNPLTLISYQMWNTNKELQKELDFILKSFNLTYVQFLLLQTVFILNQDKKFVTQQDISNYLIMDKNITSSTMRRLDFKKYVIRKTHPIDTRAKIILLTDDGEKRLLQTSKLIQLRDEKYFRLKIERQSGFERQLATLNTGVF